MTLTFNGLYPKVGEEHRFCPEYSMVGAVDLLRHQKGPVRWSQFVCIVNEHSVPGALNDPK